MSATLELKYFNTFWLKRMVGITEAVSAIGAVAPEGDYPIKPTFNDPNLPENLPLTFTFLAKDDSVNTHTINESVTKDWMIEESRIRGGYNNTSVDLGVKAYLVEDDSVQINKFSGLIHSGIFNSRTGINQTNQFSVAEEITRTIDPANGSIQRLYAEDTNLIIFQEGNTVYLQIPNLLLLMVIGNILQIENKTLYVDCLWMVLRLYLITV